MTDIFKDRTKSDTLGQSSGLLEPPFAVGPVLTVFQEQQQGLAGYPYSRRECMTVQNIRRPRFGHGY